MKYKITSVNRNSCLHMKMTIADLNIAHEMHPYMLKWCYFQRYCGCENIKERSSHLGRVFLGRQTLERPVCGSREQRSAKNNRNISLVYF